MELTGEMKNIAAGGASEREAAVAAGGAPERKPATAPNDTPEREPACTTPNDATRPTVIVMHASVGSGHRSAANAVAQALELLRDDPSLRDDVPCPEDLNVEVLDVLDFGRMRMNGDKMASMFTGPTRPIYDLTWRYTLTGRLLWAGGTAWSRIMFPRFTEHVRKVSPLAIVCTHITAANVAVGARMITGQSFPIVCVPTDYETEGLWPHLHSDLFCVANESMAETLRPRKVPEERIAITGIPARPAFRQEYDKAAGREKFGLPQDKRIALALAGAYLPTPYVRFREALDKMLPYLHRFKNTHLVIVAGADAEYAAHLRRECDELGIPNATVLDYVEGMAELMAASDLVICKPGGLTVTECLCAKAPMILLGRAYGQENINVRMLTSLGAALHVTTARELVGAMGHIDANPAIVEAMLTQGSYLRSTLREGRCAWPPPSRAPTPTCAKSASFTFTGGTPPHISVNAFGFAPNWKGTTEQLWLHSTIWGLAPRRLPP